ncbi:carbamate kinase [Candidiatus Paracoxiella cheracis]|uniref:carbamate kinase n=1 Tax=Candidiatus Paracoxiella cheracis TaxID=3405120 RepID=UPI003BF4A8FD
MLLVIALGGNALLQRGEPLESDLLRKNVKVAATVIAKAAEEHDIVIAHGNGPQVGLLALQADAYKKVHPYPLDILDAESQGMIGYLLQQEIGNYLQSKSVATLLTQVLVDAKDPAFQSPSKPIGPVYTESQAKAIQQAHDWILKPDGQYFRRVVPSPKPQHIYELDAIKLLLQANTMVIAGGGGGIPCIKTGDKQLKGVEAVIDKDLTASLLARQLKAESLVILTDVDAVYENWGTSAAKAIHNISSKTLRQYQFAAGSMGPKVEAACQFVDATLRPVMIGKLSDLNEILKGKGGTLITH